MQLGLVQGGSPQVGTLQAGTLQIDAGEIPVPEVSATQVRAGAVGALAWLAVLSRSRHDDRFRGSCRANQGGNGGNDRHKGREKEACCDRH